MTDKDKILTTVVGTIPESAWNTLVTTITDTFKDIISPITSTSKGVSLLIETKFNKFSDAEKLISSEVLKKVAQKIKESDISGVSKDCKTSVILEAVEESAKENQSDLQELWASLIANEIKEGTGHPEFIRLIKRLTSKNASNLFSIYKASSKVGKYLESKNRLDGARSTLNINIEQNSYYLNKGKTVNELLPKQSKALEKIEKEILTLKNEIDFEKDFSFSHLINIGLIKHSEIEGVNSYELTEVGVEFIKSVV